MSGQPGWGLPTSPPERRFEVLRDPIRATVLISSLVMIVGARLSWIDAELPYQGHFEVSGFDHAGDGAITFLAALAMGGWALSGAIRSKIVPLVLLPIAIGLTGLLVMRIAVQDAESLIASYEHLGGSGSIAIGLWLTIAGLVALTVVGAIHVYRLRREIRITISIALGDVGAIVGAIAGAILGAIASSALVGRFVVTENAAVVASTQTLAAILFGFLGAWLGLKTGRVVADAIHPGPIRRIGP
jgi:hypothetical protein